MSLFRAQMILFGLAFLMVIAAAVCLARDDLADGFICVGAGFGILWISEQL